MPVAFTDAPVLVDVPRKRWTRAEVDALAATGLFGEERLELLEGELINKMGKKRPHVNSCAILFEWLTVTFGSRRVLQKAPIDVAPGDNAASEPEPDLMVLTRPFSDFTDRNPQPEDLALIIEVSDSTLALDLTVKAGLYARAGIVEYWVLDIPGRRIIVHRRPVAGHYTEIAAYSNDETVAPLAAPQAGLRVSAAS